jgi:hypothetical protein
MAFSSRSAHNGDSARASYCRDGHLTPRDFIGFGRGPPLGAGPQHSDVDRAHGFGPKGWRAAPSPRADGKKSASSGSKHVRQSPALAFPSLCCKAAASRYHLVQGGNLMRAGTRLSRSHWPHRLGGWTQAMAAVRIRLRRFSAGIVALRSTQRETRDSSLQGVGKAMRAGKMFSCCCYP